MTTTALSEVLAKMRAFSGENWEFSERCADEIESALESAEPVAWIAVYPDGKFEGDPVFKPTPYLFEYNEAEGHPLRPLVFAYAKPAAKVEAPSGIPFAGVDPKFCPGSDPENPQAEDEVAPTPASVPDGWLPIESAPMDGTEVDVFITSTAEGDDGGYRVPNAWWCRALGRWRSYHDHQQGWGVEPTHWMPIPAPPTNQEGAAP